MEGRSFLSLGILHTGPVPMHYQFMAHSNWGPEEMWVARRALEEENSQDPEQAFCVGSSNQQEMEQKELQEAFTLWSQGPLPSGPLPGVLTC